MKPIVTMIDFDNKRLVQSIINFFLKKKHISEAQDHCCKTSDIKFNYEFYKNYSKAIQDKNVLCTWCKNKIRVIKFLK